MHESVYNYEATAVDGSTVSLKNFAGKALLIVNTASKCGFTPQYDGLEELHREYGDRGLVVLGFPCDQFAHQEPGTDSEIAAFCRKNFGVSFQLMSKIEVNGSDTHPLYEFLKNRAPGVIGSSVKWNFTKFLVAPDGTSVKRFAPVVAPDKLKPHIEKVLAQ